MWKFARLVLLVCLSYWQHCLADQDATKCSTRTMTKGIQISIITHHNKTGQYIEQVKIEDAQGNPLNSSAWSVAVNKGNTTCLGHSCDLVKTVLTPLVRTAPPDYMHVENLGYYKYHGESRTWGEAKMICESEGSNLVVINSMMEETVVTSLFQRHISKPVAGRNYLLSVGFNDIVVQGQYLTVLGQPLSCTGYVNWAPGQPDNASGNENCGAIFNSGQLNDVSCSVRLPFMCEHEL